ncbi:MAG: phosphate-starvation-inducible PsiE family protein [Deltaproteobacteria bacterium]|nr:phosphate-starvation-inducible PsiE family protein [Candidatus Zymogenaceae bacterium]
MKNIVFTVLDRFENTVILVLMVLMTAVLLLATADLVYLIITDIITPPRFLLEIREILEIFGLFLLVLVGLELLETIKVYLSEHVIRLYVVFEIALITVVRDVIILDSKKLSGVSLLGIGVLIITLSVGYYLIHITHEKKKGEDSESVRPHESDDE